MDLTQFKHLIKNLCLNSLQDFQPLYCKVTQPDPTKILNYFKLNKLSRNL